MPTATPTSSAAPKQDYRHRRRLKKATEWLATELAAGPVISTDLFSAAKEQQIRREHLREAAEAMGIEIVQYGFSGSFAWRLPPTTDRAADGR